MKRREIDILELLIQYEKMDVTALAEKLGVSQVTIRKDLIELEKSGVIRREHGYAALYGKDNIGNRLAYHYEQKCRIAKLAVSLVSDCETLMVENGSCCALFAEAVASTKSNTTIITNSAFIANYIRGINGARIVLLGGDYQPRNQAVVGPILRASAEQFCVEKLFIGIDGYTKERGFFGDDHLCVQAVRDMAMHAEKVYALTESSKFNGHGIVPLDLPNKVQYVVTDSSLSAQAETALTEQGVHVYKTNAVDG